MSQDNQNEENNNKLIKVLSQSFDNIKNDATLNSEQIKDKIYNVYYFIISLQLLLLIKEKAQIIHDKQNDDIISFYNNSLSPFIKELITSNPSYTTISTLSSEIEKLFNVAVVTTIVAVTMDVAANY